jgi:Na+(H+)/acetate symporter ActP
VNPLFTPSHRLRHALKQNLGTTDRIIRILAAVIVAVLYFTDQISGTAAIILGLFAVIFLLTSAMSFCPLYLPFKFSTKKSAPEGK